MSDSDTLKLLAPRPFFTDLKSFLGAKFFSAKVCFLDFDGISTVGVEDKSDPDEDEPCLERNFVALCFGTNNNFSQSSIVVLS